MYSIVLVMGYLMRWTILALFVRKMSHAHLKRSWWLLQVPKELAECVVDFILHGVVNSSTLIQRFLAERRKEKLNDETTAQSKL